MRLVLVSSRSLRSGLETNGGSQCRDALSRHLEYKLKPWTCGRDRLCGSLHEPKIAIYQMMAQTLFAEGKWLENRVKTYYEVGPKTPQPADLVHARKQVMTKILKGVST